MALTTEEHALKAEALTLMKKFGKTIYKRDGIEIRVIEGEPDVKVKVRKPGEDEDDERTDDTEDASQEDGAVIEVSGGDENSTAAPE